jgi:hypothetical protein
MTLADTYSAPLTKQEPHSSPLQPPTETELKAKTVQITSPEAKAEEKVAHAPLVKAKPKRTFGLWAVDTLIYPVITHFGVFAVSVWASYVSNFRNKTDVNPNDSFLKRAHSHAANWMKDRTEKYYDKPLERMGFNPESEAAKTFKMVLFSFVDGCFVAPFTKLLEDRREAMAKRIDKAFGIKPEDESVYAAEPKQTWGSVLLGRAKTAAIIVPIAAALQKFSVTSAPRGFDVRITEDGDGLKNLNQSFLGAFGRWMQRNVMDRGARHFSAIDKFQKSLTTPDGSNPGEKFSYTLAFETFYTAVCTFCLYAFSRGIARKKDAKKHEAEERLAAAHSRQDSAEAKSAPHVDVKKQAEPESVVAEKVERADWRTRTKESAAEAQFAGFAKA